MKTAIFFVRGGKNLSNMEMKFVIWQQSPLCGLAEGWRLLWWGGEGRQGWAVGGAQPTAVWCPHAGLGPCTALLGVACAVTPQTHGIRALCLSDQLQGACPVSFTGPKQVHPVAGWRLALRVQLQTRIACVLLETAAWCR